ncbi:unnamed protein product [Rotaria sp. Silwood2]|nr:unnamed protein product [Rotaria sp. Silwood2]CAF3288184.1 unnamed protein product [Rotaria sp. Silwood2]CAF3422460.1 unnamed protein product [Rotaria sp. Silwood2]CAF3472675.1 unnamed protein product [Rotaria sp. Silwood2]CAF4631928.1 unnamed protein product [Rotaria sp. Silwood2]
MAGNRWEWLGMDGNARMSFFPLAYFGYWKIDFIFDRSDFKSVNQKSFSQEGIKDICWLKTLNRFIFISSKEIFTLNEKRMILDPCQLYFNSNISWERGTCSETSLFLSNFGQNPFIVELNLCPSVHFNKCYQSEIISQENEVINDIKYNNGYIAIILENVLINQSRFELRSN